VVLSTPLLFASFFILINALRGAATLLIQASTAHTLHSSPTKGDDATHASTLSPSCEPEQVKKMEFKEDAKKKSKAERQARRANDPLGLA